MNKYIFSTLALLSLFVVLPLRAQRARSTSYAREASSIVAKYKKELSRLSTSTVTVADDTTEVAMSPYLYRLIGPGIYYRSVLTDKFRLDYELPGTSVPMMTTGLIDERKLVRSTLDQVLLNTYATRPELFHYYDAQIESENIITASPTAGAKVEDLTAIYDKVTEITDVADVVDNVEVDLQIKKPNFWTTSGKFSLQFTQNYFSENWYNGGNNNVTLLSNLVLEANYND
jgi:hypothetical protein